MKVINSKQISPFGGLNFVLKALDNLSIGDLLNNELPGLPKQSQYETTTYFPEFYGSNQPLMPKAFGQYPYVLVPAFLMPSAVFMHVLSIVQLRKTVKAAIDKSKSQTLMSAGL